jgi:hypothetical protein
MARGARMSVTAWHHRETIRLRLALKCRIWKVLLSYQTDFGPFAAADVERAMRLHEGAGGKARQSLRRLASRKHYCCTQTTRVKMTPEVESRLHPRGTVMETGPARCLNESISQEQKDHFRSDAGEETIQACYDLISSGRPLSEILAALKQIGPLDKQRRSERGLRDTQILEVAGEVCAALPHWQTAQVSKPLESRLLDQSQDISAALVPTRGDWSHSLVNLSARRSAESARVESHLGIKLPRPIGVVLFWLVPALSLTVVGVGGELLSNADRTWKATEATAGPKAILRTVEGTEDVTAPRPEAAETSASAPAISAMSRNAPELLPNRPPPPNSPSVTASRRSIQHRHTQVQRPFPTEWKIPTRLTDGF